MQKKNCPKILTLNLHIITILPVLSNKGNKDKIALDYARISIEYCMGEKGSFSSKLISRVRKILTQCDNFKAIFCFPFYINDNRFHFVVHLFWHHRRQRCGKIITDQLTTTDFSYHILTSFGINMLTDMDKTFPAESNHDIHRRSQNNVGKQGKSQNNNL